MENKLSLTQVLQQIRKIIGNTTLKLELWSDNNINFCVYESEIVVELDKNGKASIDVESMHNVQKISSKQINELFKMMNLIEENSEVILQCIEDLSKNCKICPDCGAGIFNMLNDGGYECKHCDCVFYV